MVLDANAEDRGEGVSVDLTCLSEAGHSVLLRAQHFKPWLYVGWTGPANKATVDALIQAITNKFRYIFTDSVVFYATCMYTSVVVY